MGFKYLLLSVIFVVFVTPHYSSSAAVWKGHHFKFIPSIVIPDRIIQRLEQRQKSFRCISEGFFGDPIDCTKFYRCVRNPGAPNYFDRYTFECPPGTAFDDYIHACNFIAAVSRCASFPSNLGSPATTGSYGPSTTMKPIQTDPPPTTTTSTFPPFSTTLGTDSTTSWPTESTIDFQSSTILGSSTLDSLGVTGTTLTSLDSTTASSATTEGISTETAVSTESTTTDGTTTTTLESTTTDGTTTTTLESTTTDGTTTTTLESTTTEVTPESITDSSTESTTSERTTTTDSSEITETTKFPESSTTIEPTTETSGSTRIPLEESTTMEETTDLSSSEPTSQGSTTDESSTDVSSLEITGTTPTFIGSTPTESLTAEFNTEVSTTDVTATTSPMFTSTTESTITEFTEEFTFSTESETLSPPSLTLDMSTTLDPLQTTENTVSTTESSAIASTLSPLPSLAELLALVDCSQDSSGMMDLSLKRVPNNCNIFYQCVFNEGIKPGISLFSCPAGQLFDEPSASCKNPGDTTPCSTPIVPPQPEANTTAEFNDLASQLCQDETFHRFPSNCNFFFQCLRSGSAYKLHLFACPGGLVYDEPTSTCQTPENSTPCGNSNEVSTPSPILFSLMPASQYNCIIPGNFPYELDCDHFYRCYEVLPGILNGLLYQCPVGYSFSTVSGRCEVKESQPICQRRRLNNRRRFPTGGIRLNIQDLPFFFRY